MDEELAGDTTLQFSDAVSSRLGDSASLVTYNTEHEDRKGTLGSILHPVTFTASYVMYLTQRSSRGWDVHTRITVGGSLRVSSKG